ncbi:MAG TPA: transporter, partial [bacterium]|nr:transporter [bacterium]
RARFYSEGNQVRTAQFLVSTLSCVLLVFSSAAALPIVGASANTIPAGTFMLDVWGIWQDYSVTYKATGDNPGWCGLESGRTVTAGSFVPRIYYGVTDRFTVRVSLPFEDRYGEDTEADGGGKSNTGLGDIIIDPKIQVYRGEGGFPRAALLAGVRFPTGATESVEPGLVPPISDGSTDYMLGVVGTHKIDSTTMHVCATYWMNGAKKWGGDSPDLIVGLASVEMELDEDWALLWEYKGVFGTEHSEFTRTYICPGISWSGSNTTIGFSGLVSAVREGAGLDFDWAPYFRVYYRFF